MGIKSITTLVVLTGLLLLGAAGYFIGGFYGIGADEPHWPVTEELIAEVRDASITRASDGVEVPADLGSDERIRRGAGNYQAMCAVCHLTPGQQSGELFAGLYPQPPRFAMQQSINPQRGFWVIKHGIKMTGMPAWGGSNTDDDIWSLVAFLRAMPGMDEEGYQTLVASSDGHTHGGVATDGHDNSDGHHDIEKSAKDEHFADGHTH
ncbi:MAG: cytochrome c [Chromatiales bacterium]|nr:cytochrome c [Chromatiales bacterium]